MKKSLFLTFTAIIFVFCTACTSENSPETAFSDWRENFTGFDCTADITMLDGEEVMTYNITASYSDEECKLTVNSPETIKGITATRIGEETDLQFEDLIVNLGDVDGVSPMNSLVILGDAIKSGYINLSYVEQGGDLDLLASQIDVGDEITVYLWQNAEDFTPLYADIKVVDEVIIKIEMAEWKTN